MADIMTAPNLLSSLSWETGDASAGAQEYVICSTLCWILVLEAKLMGEEQIWKNYSYFCWVYLWQLYHTSEINDTCACMTSYFNKLLGMGLGSCKNRFFFFLFAFLLYLLTQIFHNLWKRKQFIWDGEDMEKATSSWDTLGTALNGLARGRLLFLWVHTGSMQPILILDR